MDLIVCMKRVPDSAAKIRVADDGKGIDSSGVDYVISPYDEMALEKAIQLKEEHGGTVTVICLGPPQATKEIRQALAMGADSAVHIKDEGAARGPLGIAKALTEAIRGREFDMLFFGRQSIDADNSAVGVMVAQMLDLPAVTLVTKVGIEDGKAVVHRESEAGTEVIEVGMPVVLSAQRGLAEPRYPSIKGIMKAKKKPLEEVTPAEASGALSLDALHPPADRVGGRIVGEGVEAVPELVRLLRQEAKVL